MSDLMIGCCGCIYMIVFITMNSLVLGYSYYASIEGFDVLTVTDSVKMDWNQPLIQSVYSVNKD
jgi:hypothetical protein